MAVIVVKGMRAIDVVGRSYSVYKRHDGPDYYVWPNNRTMQKIYSNKRGMAYFWTEWGPINVKIRVKAGSVRNG